jgi:hypothetical protein
MLWACFAWHVKRLQLPRARHATQPKPERWTNLCFKWPALWGFVPFKAHGLAKPLEVHGLQRAHHQHRRRSATMQ